MGESGPPPDKLSPWPFAGMIGMACVFFLYAATPVAVPGVSGWLVALLLLVWCGALVLAVRWWTPRPVALAVLPGVLAGGWLLLLVGARAAGWA